MKSKALVTLVVRTFVIIHRIHATSFYNNDICAYDRTHGRAHAEGHVWLYILAKMSHQVKLEGHFASRFPC